MKRDARAHGAALDPRRLAEYRTRLLVDRRTLTQHLLCSAGVPASPLGHVVGDTADRAAADADGHVTAQLEGSLSGTLAEIDHALERMSRSRYGFCEDCGRRIPAARLRALPSATLCVRCKQGEEAEAKLEREPLRWGEFEGVPADGDDADPADRVRRLGL
jgi:RNA polymerase-binding protein DksA